MALTPYERVHLAMAPFGAELYRRVRRELAGLISNLEQPVRVLDVGGRKSQATIGLPVEVTVIDLPRESDVQHELRLGLDDTGMRRLGSSRTNITEVLVGDVIQYDFEGRTYPAIVSIEVIEHVPDDEGFVAKLATLVEPDGFVYLTTPNGDYVANHNPDHLRHYRRHELQELLERHFDDVIVTYAVKTGTNRTIGLPRMSPRHPVRSLRGAWANRLNERESRYMTFEPVGSAHLIAVARPKVQSAPPVG